MGKPTFADARIYRRHPPAHRQLIVAWFAQAKESVWRHKHSLWLQEGFWRVEGEIVWGEIRCRRCGRPGVISNAEKPWFAGALFEERCPRKSA